MSLIDFGRWGFFMLVTIGEIYGMVHLDSKCVNDRWRVVLRFWLAG